MVFNSNSGHKNDVPKFIKMGLVKKLIFNKHEHIFKRTIKVLLKEQTISSCGFKTKAKLNALPHSIRVVVIYVSQLPNWNGETPGDLGYIWLLFWSGFGSLEHEPIDMPSIMWTISEQWSIRTNDPLIYPFLDNI